MLDMLQTGRPLSTGARLMGFPRLATSLCLRKGFRISAGIVINGKHESASLSSLLVP